MPRKSRGAYLKWRKDKKAWYVYEYIGGREICQSTGITKPSPAPHDALEEYLVCKRQVVGPTAPEQRMIADLLTDYDQEHGRFLKSQHTFETCLTRLLEFWADYPASHITEATCKAYHEFRTRQFRTRPKSKWLYKDQNKRAISPAIVARELSVLSAAIRHDTKKKRLIHPPHVYLPKFDNRKDRWLTRSEAGALLRAARTERDSRKYLPLFILLGLYTGARHSAILGLRWEQVNIEAGLIDFNDPKMEKTKKGRSLQKMPKRLMTFLRRRYAKKGYIIHKNGLPFKSVKKAFGEACDRAGLVGVSPHTLRHSAASWQAQRGVPFPVIARFIGHADSRTTERIYAHHDPSYLQEAADALDARPASVARPLARPEKRNAIGKKKKKAGKP